MYWILMSERSDEYEASIDDLPVRVSELELSFDSGSAMAESPPVIEVPLERHADESLTDNLVVPTRLGLLINGKVKAVFDKLGIGNIQYFRARLVGPGGHADSSYWIANVIGARACVDTARSELTFFRDGGIEFIDKLALDLQPNVDHGHIFRLAEFPALLIISDALKGELESAGVTGFRIYRPEEFTL